MKRKSQGRSRLSQNQMEKKCWCNVGVTHTTFGGVIVTSKFPSIFFLGGWYKKKPKKIKSKSSSFFNQSNYLNQIEKKNQQTKFTQIFQIYLQIFWNLSIFFLQTLKEMCGRTACTLAPDVKKTFKIFDHHLLNLIFWTKILQQTLDTRGTPRNKEKYSPRYNMPPQAYLPCIVYVNQQ